MPKALRTLPDGAKFAWVVDWGRTSEGSLSVYDVATYDDGRYDGAGTIGWNQAVGFALDVTTRRSKDSFGKRFRAGTARLTMDNTNGRWSGVDAGFAPGDFVRLQVEITPALGGAPTTAGVFYGRVESSTDKLRGGIDVTQVNVVGRFSEWAVIDQDAGPPVGAGELTDARMERLFNEYRFDWSEVTQYGTPKVAMQATNLAQPALFNAQITMDSAGGDFAEDPDGSFIVAYRDWLIEAPHSTTVQWLLGGAGIGIDNAEPSRELQIVVNDSTVANTGGVAQTAEDAGSISRFGRRTSRRLDLIAQEDSQAQYLAQRAVASLKSVRPRVRSVTVQAIDEASALFCQTAKLGDLTLVQVESINGWSNLFAAHIIGIEHSTRGVQWSTTIRLDDAAVDNTDGGFWYEAFNEGFSLGGQP